MESIEVKRRLLNQTTSKRCYFCDSENFDGIEIRLFMKTPDGTIPLNTSGTVCKICGHIDLFVIGSNDANKDRSNQTISKR